MDLFLLLLYIELFWLNFVNFDLNICDLLVLGIWWYSFRLEPYECYIVVIYRQTHQ